MISASLAEVRRFPLQDPDNHVKAIPMNSSAAATMIPILAVIAAIAVVAFITRSRVAFVVGSLTCWCAVMASQRVEYSDYQSVEAAIMADVRYRWQHGWDVAPMAGLVGTVVGLVCSECWSAVAGSRPENRVPACRNLEK